MNSVQVALQSALKKFLRTLLATGLAALAASLPVIIDVFRAASQQGDMFEKTAFGLVISVLVAGLAFVEKWLKGYGKPTP
jgi:multidrug efflux pump subunit AcrB